jgi:predicted PurR-regulated permease PerM
VYLFDHHTESKGRRSPKSTLIKEVAIVLMVGAIAVFILYNTQDDIQVFINRNASGSIALTVILAFIPTFFIATPMLNREFRNSVDKRKVDKTWEDVEKVEKRYSEDEKELKGEAGLDVEDSVNKQDQKGIK